MIRISLRLLPRLLCLAVLGVSPAFAALPVVVSNTSNLLPNTPNQLLQFLVSGNDAIAGEYLTIQVNDGTSGPTLGSINPTGNADPFADTIFAGNNLGQLESGILGAGPYAGRLALVATITNAGTVVNNGVLINLLVSTGPADVSPFTISLLNTVSGEEDSYFVLPDLTKFSPLQPHNKFSISAAPIREWIFDGGGTWNNDARWSPFAPFTIGDQAHFLGALVSADATITLDGNRTVGSVTFDNALRSYTIAPGTGGSLLLNNGTSSAAISVLSGSHTISAPLVLHTTNQLSVAGAANTLTLGGAVSGPASSLSFTGPGSLLVSGAATIGGKIIVNSGNVVFSGNTAHSIRDVSGEGNLAVEAGASLESDGIVASTLRVDGSLTVRPNGSVRGASHVDNLILGGATDAWTGKIDLKDNVLIIDAESEAQQDQIKAEVRNAVASGKAGGTWDGNGITSSTIPQANATTFALAYAMAIGDSGDIVTLAAYRGQPIMNDHTTLVVMARNGDVNLDGRVNAFDLNLLAANYQSTGADWTNGDFTGDGVVNAFDLNLLALNWQAGVPGQGGPFGLEAVPEPGTFVLGALAALGLLARRGRRAVLTPSRFPAG